MQSELCNNVQNYAKKCSSGVFFIDTHCCNFFDNLPDYQAVVCGETEIRTPDALLAHTRFPGVLSLFLNSHNLNMLQNAVFVCAIRLQSRGKSEQLWEGCIISLFNIK